MQGTVKDEVGWGIASAQVIVRSAADSSLKAFVSADVRGDFELNLESNLYQFEVRMLGYLTQKRELLVEKSNYRKLNLDFVLKENPEILGEVAVEARRLPVIEKQDTLEFDAEYFKGVGDDKVVDVLKKIPGMEVRDDGTIYYKGKRIKDILIEGESLFSKSPETISKAFPADAVDKIQVLDNYTEFGGRKNPFGEDKAINLTLRDDKKNVLFGEIAAVAGAGNDALNDKAKVRYRLHGNTFWIKKKVKTMFLTDINNVGKHTFDVRSYLEFTGSLYNRRNINLNDAPISQAQTELPPQVDTYFSALSTAFSFSDKLKLRSYAFFNQKNTQHFNQIQRIFGSPNLDSPYLATANFENRNLLATLHNRLFYVPNQKHSFNFTLEFSPQNQNQNGTNRVLFLGLENQNEDQHRYFQFKTRLGAAHLFTIDEKNTLDTDINFIYNPNIDRLRLASTEDVFSTLLPANALIHNGDTLQFFEIALQNRINSYQVEWKTTHTYKVKKRWEWKNEIGTNLQTHKADFVWQNEPIANFKLPNSLDLSNNFWYNRAYIGTHLAYIHKLFRLQIGSNLAYYDLDFVGKSNQFRQNEWRFEPNVSLHLNLPWSQNLTFQYHYRNEMPSYQDLNESFAIEDFRTLRRGFSPLKLMPTHSFSGQYFLMHLFSRTQIFLMFNYDKSPLSISSSQVITAGAQASQALQVSRENRFFTGNFSKSFDGKVPLTLRGSFSLTQFESENVLNNTTNHFQNYMQNYSFFAQTRFKKKFNIELSWRNQRNRYLSDLQPDALKSQMHYLRGSLVFEFFEKLIIKPQAEQVFFLRQNEEMRQFFFLNGTISYKINKKYQIEAESFNVLNTNQINSISISPFYEETNQKALLGRFWLLGLKRNF